jgi:hypothetical protein
MLPARREGVVLGDARVVVRCGKRRSCVEDIKTPSIDNPKPVISAEREPSRSSCSGSKGDDEEMSIMLSRMLEDER